MKNAFHAGFVAFATGTAAILPAMRSRSKTGPNSPRKEGFRQAKAMVIDMAFAAKQHKRILAVLSLLLCIWMPVLSSCTPAADTDGASGTVFTDALGRQVHPDGVPARTACLLGSFADIWMLSGGEVCAAAEDAWDDFGLPLGDAVNIGGAHSPNTELLLSAEPDFVIASASTASHVGLCDLLEAAGITVAYFDVMNFDDYLSMLRICTDITGREDLWEQNGLRLQAEIEAIKAQFSEQVGEDERRVLLLRAASGFVKAKGSAGTVLGEMLSDLGCINIADSDTHLLENLSVEAVLAAEPHHIFIVTMGADTAAAMKSVEELLESHPAWQTLDAVQSGRIHVMDRALYHLKPNARWAEAYRTLYEIFIEQSP